MFTRIEAVGFEYPTVVSTFVEFLCKELQISPRHITVETMDPSVYLSTKTLGLVMDIEPEEFVIMVYEKHRNITQICNTIAHEMIHIKQFLYDNLNYWLHNSEDIPYMDCWWEVEAYSNSFGLVKKFTESIEIEKQV